MNLREISKPKNSKTMNENLEKLFGARIRIEDFTLEQLQDARNKIRTKLSQVETTESYSAVLKDNSYQKNKLFLDVLNTAIQEREEIEEKGQKPDYLDFDKDGNTKEPMKKALADKKKKGPVKEEDLEEKSVSQAQQQAAGAALAAKRGDAPKTNLKGASKEMMKMSTKELEKFAGTKHKGLPKHKNESVIKEGEEDKAELVMAAKDMVDRITSWMEDTAEMQAESMLELGDAIRDELGQVESDNYIQTVKPALEELYSTLEATRKSLTNGVTILTGEGGPAEPMGAEVPAEEEPELEPTVGAEEMPGEETFGAAAAAVGGEEEAGREKRESKQFQNRAMRESLLLSRTLGQILSSKKK